MRHNAPNSSMGSGEWHKNASPDRFPLGWPGADAPPTFLECADAARADYLVTGNQRHFPKFWKKTKVITPREFITLVAPHLAS